MLAGGLVNREFNHKLCAFPIRGIQEVLTSPVGLGSIYTRDPQFIWQVKRDWYGLDFDYIRSHPNCLYWRVLPTAKYDDRLLSFMPEGAIQRNLDHIRDHYQRTDEEVEEWYIRRPDKYLSQNQVDTFVENCTKVLLAAYHLLVTERVKPADRTSVLEMDIIRNVRVIHPHIAGEL